MSAGTARAVAAITEDGSCAWTDWFVLAAGETYEWHVTEYTGTWDDRRGCE